MQKVAFSKVRHLLTLVDPLEQQLIQLQVEQEKSAVAVLVHAGDEVGGGFEQMAVLALDIRLDVGEVTEYHPVDKLLLGMVSAAPHTHSEHLQTYIYGKFNA